MSSDQEDRRVREQRVALGEQIRILRKRTGESQLAFAHRAGVDRKAMYRIENGTHAVRIDQYIRVLLALHVPLGDLLADAVSRSLDADEDGQG